MNDGKKDALQILLNSETMLSALYDVFNTVIEANRPNITVIDTNEMLGEKYRGYEISKNILGQAFQSLEALRAPGKEKEAEVLHI